MALTDILITGLETLVKDIIQASRDAGQEASGYTYGHITSEVSAVSGTGGTLAHGAVYAPIYFYTLIRGRGPGKVPVNMAEIIMEWAGYKGITFDSPEELVRFGNAVAWKIRREGSELYRNHLYVDIVDTPTRIFEKWLEEQVDIAVTTSITAAFNAENFNGHGYIV